MRLLVAALIISFTWSLNAQTYSSVADIVTVYSQNERFYLRSAPFDNQTPSLHGFTQVFASGSTEPLYTIRRGFDSVQSNSNNLVLSDDGNTILYLIPWGAVESKDGLKSVSIYRRGELVKSYTASEITGCNLDKERCSILYSNYDQVVDKEKSSWGTNQYKKVYKAGVNEEERFLSDFPVFAHDDSVYVIDSKKNLHRIGLADARHIDTKLFTRHFDEVKGLGRFNRTIIDRFDVPMYPEFPRLRSGLNTSISLGRSIGMRPYDIYSKTDEKYKRYSFTVSGFLKRDGSFEVTHFESRDDVPKDLILGFFAKSKFVTSLIPKVVDRWFISEKIFFFRKANSAIAMRERRAEMSEEKKYRQELLVAEAINGRYIPKDLGDAFEQMDKELPEITRKEMAAKEKRNDMIDYHMGLGMWMRNNWGLWGGSRLQRYFTDKTVTHPDDMSSVILFFYWDWLQGRKEAWKEWEKNPKSLFEDN